MEAGGTKEQEEAQKSNGREKGESGDVQPEAKEKSGAGATEAAVNNKIYGENEAEETKASGNEAQGGQEPAGKPLETEKEQGVETREKAEEARKEGQGEAEDRVAVGVSGTESKEEADGTGTPEGLQEGEGGEGVALGGNVSSPSKEGRTGSTSDEPLSPEPEEDGEYWPEFSPSSPDEGPESPTGINHPETGSTASDSPAPEGATEDTISPEVTPEQDKEQPPAPEDAATTKEKKKRPTFDRRELTRPRVPPRGQSRKAIMEKFGGAASGPAPNIKRTGGANTVKNMLLEWCRAKTRGYEHVDIQNFSSSWSSGMAFCALIHKFFPDAFDYMALDPAKRRENFALAFSTAEKLADCAQLLEVDDMVRMSVPDNKCIYTYIQELYRSLVQKGLVKTKKQ
ncbi:smoothelin-like protein 1 [Hemicordylus capensis]|uniref:smoothelin-like protein 1 n=1 Tax=Hemicordylus capensis TaxID=884348 RepID=UPI0023022848|nr:smoothelin-like protein 1 [Hemicordylus capensis]